MVRRCVEMFRSGRTMQRGFVSSAEWRCGAVSEALVPVTSFIALKQPQPLCEQGAAFRLVTLGPPPGPS